MERRSTFDLFKSEICHQAMDMYDISETGNMHDLGAVINESAKGSDFNLSFREFLGFFYSVKNKTELFELIKGEPKYYTCVPDYQYAMCAATANKLANDYDIEVPDWVWNDRYYLKQPFFGGIRKGRLRMYNMLYSPPEFKNRGLFLDENILLRI